MQFIASCFPLLTKCTWPQHWPAKSQNLLDVTSERCSTLYISGLLAWLNHPRRRRSMHQISSMYRSPLPVSSYSISQSHFQATVSGRPDQMRNGPVVPTAWSLPLVRLTESWILVPCSATRCRFWTPFHPDHSPRLTVKHSGGNVRCKTASWMLWPYRSWSHPMRNWETHAGTVCCLFSSYHFSNCHPTR